MAIPSTKTEFKDYCLRALGCGMIDVNVTDDQVDDRIDEAVQYFVQYHYDSITRCYLKYQITAEDLARATANESAGSATDSADSSVSANWFEQKNYIPVPSSVISVLDIFPFDDSSTNNLFDLRYQIRLNDLYDFSSASILQYEMVMNQLDLLQHILVGERPIRYYQHQNRLYIDGDWAEDFTVGDYLIMECYRKLDPNTYTDMWDDMHLKRYATALIKKQWGQNLSKFNDVTLLGGVSYNGQQIYDQAQEEINKIEEIIQGFQYPDSLFIA